MNDGGGERQWFFTRVKTRKIGINDNCIAPVLCAYACAPSSRGCNIYTAAGDTGFFTGYFYCSAWPSSYRWRVVRREGCLCADTRARIVMVARGTRIPTALPVHAVLYRRVFFFFYCFFFAIAVGYHFDADKHHVTTRPTAEDVRSKWKIRVLAAVRIRTRNEKITTYAGFRG
jgi:hypothetical protein